MTTGQPASGFRYWAFISYSHKDASWGRWLHKALETYRVPRRLVGMPIAAGTVPARLTPIFRDRDELPTASDLGAAVEQALSESWCLIVICSPESARSRWVNEEVLAFQRLGRGDRIHCLVVDGGPDPAAPLCFPPALEQAQAKHGNGKSEPVAADARSFGDGRSHALLKLVSGILGIGYDSLVQRDQQRRNRNMFWVTCASLALVVVLAVSTLIALTSRREALDQRSHAEGLVEFMIGDLRKKLEPDGKLATLDAVGKEALAYYAAQKSEDLDAEGLARRARALHMIGEVYDLRGELDEALKVFEQAADSTAELVAREPDNGQRIFDHAQSVFWVGFIAYQRGNITVAEPAFQEYKRLAERLVEIDPGNEDWQAEVGFANSNLGILLFHQWRLGEARAVFEQELRSASQVGPQDDKNVERQMRTAQAHAWLADVASRQGDLAGGLAHRKDEIDIYHDVLSADAKNNSAQGSLSVAERTASYLLLAMGDTGSALEHGRRAVELSKELAVLDPDNVRWIEDSAVAHANLASVLRYSDRLPEAIAAARKSTDAASQLIRLDDSVASWQLRFADSALVQASVLADSGDTGQATELASQTAGNLEARIERLKDPTDNALLLARALLLLADLHDVTGKAELARANRLRIVELLQGIDSRNRVPIERATLAAALLGLGRTDAAQPLVKGLAKAGFREPGYVAMLGRYGMGSGEGIPARTELSAAD
jgi:tetratricopeptide (TPR) repeat protein